ncbi:MAG: acyl carrier protein [Candidatus Poribacteria bacterium]|mgnify:CR=1 FL=1
MTNREKYDKVFMEIFSIEKTDLKDSLEYNSIMSWDSIGHMGLIAALEECFNISIDTDDVINFSSYKKGFEILAKYGVEL